ncbi:hypothetical protein L0F63_002203 [Massospora cicadina]|nr:hypothetical protein L0F63_002203 [Massospora cicadina]
MSQNTHMPSLSDAQPLFHLLNSIRSKASLQTSEIKEGANKALERLSDSEKKVVTDAWEAFYQSNQLQRDLILAGILLNFDFIAKLPKELSLKILSYLDAKSLVQSSSVSKAWKAVADDDSLWRTLCDQHINKKCTKCGWGLPLLLDDYLKKKRADIQLASKKRRREPLGETPEKSEDGDLARAPRRPKILDAHGFSGVDPFGPVTPNEEPCDTLAPQSKSFWKHIYRDRLSIERNWRRGKFVKRSIEVHPSGVHCQQSNQDIIITGTFASSVSIFSVKTGKRLRVLEGHLAAIRDLFFDDVRLVTVSMDGTVRVWCYRQGIPKFVIPAPGAKCLHFDKNLLAVGMVNGSIHLWDFSNTTRHSLVGHNDSVTKVRIFKGEFLVSSSEDGVARLWDLKTYRCIRLFRGHSASVNCFQFSIPNLFPIHDFRALPTSVPSSPPTRSSPPAVPPHCDMSGRGASLSTILSTTFPNPIHSQLHRTPLLVTGSADNTIRVWSLQTGQCLRQSFGHLGDVTCLDMDTLRIVSGSADGTVKVWDLDTGRCMHTLVGHVEAHSPVLCVSLADTRVLAGTGDGHLYMWDCSSDAHPACSLPALLSPADPVEGWQHHFS